MGPGSDSRGNRPLPDRGERVLFCGGRSLPDRGERFLVFTACGSRREDGMGDWEPAGPAGGGNGILRLRVLAFFPATAGRVLARNRLLSHVLIRALPSGRRRV
jgi:hypothetical protein